MLTIILIAYLGWLGGAPAWFYAGCGAAAIIRAVMWRRNRRLRAALEKILEERQGE